MSRGFAVTIVVLVSIIACFVVGAFFAAAVDKKPAVMTQATSPTSSSPTESAAVEPTPDPSPVAEVTPPPEPRAGDIISTAEVDAAVAGGKYVRVGGKKYLLLKFYVKNTGTDLGLMDVAMTVYDDQGDSWEQAFDKVFDHLTVEALDTIDYEYEVGESTAGWVAFEVETKRKPSTLQVGDDMTDFETFQVPLNGWSAVSPKSPGAKAFANAMNHGAKKADAAVVTKAEYNQIRSGMTYKRVRQIVGFAGEQMSSYGSASIYSWANDDGGNMIVQFYGGRMRGKSQYGL